MKQGEKETQEYIKFLENNVLKLEKEVLKQKNDYSRTLNNLYKKQHEKTEEYKQQIEQKNIELIKKDEIINFAAQKYTALWCLYIKNKR